MANPLINGQQDFFLNLEGWGARPKRWRTEGHRSTKQQPKRMKIIEWGGGGEWVKGAEKWWGSKGNQPIDEKMKIYKNRRAVGIYRWSGANS